MPGTQAEETRETGKYIADASGSWLSSFAFVLGLVGIVVAILAILRANAIESSVLSKLDTAIAKIEQVKKQAAATARELEQGAEPAIDKEVSKKGHLGSSVLLPTTAASATKEELEAEATFVTDRLVAFLPSEARALHVKAMLLAQLHKTQDALQLWTRCIELDGKTEPYYVNLAAIAIDRGDIDLAIKTLQNAKSVGLSSPNISHHLALALHGKGRSSEAIAAAQEGLASDAQSASLWLILGQARLQIGDLSDAEASLKRAVSLGARTKTGYFALFNAMMRLGKREEALEYRELYTLASKERELSADERYKILSEDEARRVAVSVLSEAAALYLAIPASAEAEHLYLRILALDPANQPALNELARIYSDRKEQGSEAHVWRRLIAVAPQNLMNYLRLAKVQAELGRDHEAEATIKLAISLAPQEVRGYAAMAEYTLELGQAEKSTWYVQQALDRKPSQEGFMLLARGLRALGRNADADEAAQKAGEISQQVVPSLGEE